MYQAKQRCWYSVTTIIGPMDVGGDYLPIAVSRRAVRAESGGRTAQIKHAWHGPLWATMASGSVTAITCTIGTAEKSRKECASISARARWNPDSILIPGGDIMLSAGVGDIISATTERLNLLSGSRVGTRWRDCLVERPGTNAIDAIRLATIDNNGDHVGIVFEDDGRIARFERVQSELTALKPLEPVASPAGIPLVAGAGHHPAWRTGTAAHS